ncbi:MAG: hypothetical protein ACKVS8_08980 [Phycisphaerales bacterium]
MTRPALLALALLCLAGGCAAPAPTQTQLDVASATYPAAFQSARDVLREFDFILERVDAQAGILATAIKPTAGAATPWDQEQTSLSNEVEDLFNRQARSVRISFSAPDEPGQTDLRRATSPLNMRIVATLYRRQRPGWRPEPTGVALHRHWQDTQSPSPPLRPGDEPAEQIVAFDEDRALAALLAERIRERLARPTVPGQMPPSVPVSAP